MPDKNVQLPDGRVVAFPDSMADADIAAVIKKQLAPKETALGSQLRQMTQAMSGQTTMLSPEEKAQGEAGAKDAAKAGFETIGGVLGGGSVPVIRGVVGALVRVLGTGLGAGIGNVAGQVITTGKVDPLDTAKAAGTWGALQGGGELLGSLSGLKSSLSRLMYSGEVAADGTPELSKVGRSILHPTELPENVLRAALPPTPEAQAAMKAQAGEATAAKLDEQMKAIEAGRQKDLADWAKLQTQQGQESAAAVRRQAILDKNAPQPSPFAGATSSATPLGSAKLPPAGDIPKGSPSLFAEGGGFKAPEPSVIQSPLSPAPPINKTLVSYDRNLLVHMARGGDLSALRELIRNPGGIDVATAVPNSKYLLEGGAPTAIYGGPGSTKP
jgi:hypothetical protein